MSTFCGRLYEHYNNHGISWQASLGEYIIFLMFSILILSLPLLILLVPYFLHKISGYVVLLVAGAMLIATTFESLFASGYITDHNNTQLIYDYARHSKTVLAGGFIGTVFFILSVFKLSKTKRVN